MTRCQRIEALEVAHQRRLATRYAPPGWTTDALLDAAIAWLEQPLEAQRESMPMFTTVELAEIRSWLPRYRRARMAGR